MLKPVLLSHFNGNQDQTSYTASTGQVCTFSGTAKLDTAQKEFGTTSLKINGNPNRITLPVSSNYSFGSGNFTIDFWAYLVGPTWTTRTLLVYSGNTMNWSGPDSILWTAAIYGDQNLYFQYKFEEGGPFSVSGALTSGFFDSWHHIAFVKNGATVTVYVDGTSKASLGSAPAMLTTMVPTGLYIGGRPDSVGSWDGWLDEIRIVKGQAVWTSNFTPPTSEYILNLNSFSASSVGDGTAVTSTISPSDLLNSIQAAYPGDTYFDSTAELGNVLVYYTHQAGRQEKRIQHDIVNRQGTVSWSPYAQDGTWQKTKIIAFDKEGASVILNRAAIGTEEDITHSGGAIYLNT